MKQNISYDELVQMKGGDAEEYKLWCENHGEEPSEANAELFVEMSDERAMQLMATL